MTTLKEQMALDIATVFNVDEFAETCTYQPLTGDSLTIQAVIDRGDSLQDMARNSLPAAVAVIHLQKSQVSSPKAHEKIIIGEEEWEILDEVRSDFLVVSVSAVKNTRTRKHWCYQF